jgi:diguanylate cyclase (GGDEF)-like protein
VAHDLDEAAALRAAHRATRAILRAPDAASAQRELVALCGDLGIALVSGDDDGAHDGALPIDISLGEGEPLVPAEADARQRRLIERYVVPAVSDARIVVERSRRTAHLAQRASIDALTGVWSRGSLMHAVTGASVGDALALVDLDHFKAVNDTWGHSAGDAVLSAFAGHLSGALRGSDVVGRYGGEEFVVLLPATSHRNACATVARLKDSWAVARPREITFSAGIASVTGSPDGITPAGIAALGRADSLLYAAKRDGRDRVHCGSEPCRCRLEEAS